MRATHTATRPPELAGREQPIRITREDLVRLRTLVERSIDAGHAAAAEALEAELDRAIVVPQDHVPHDVVTMRSRVVFEDVETKVRREAVLVYPDEANFAQSHISVLAPVGTALLGLAVGQCITWPVPGGAHRTLRVVELLYQPEAAGDFHR